LAVGKIQKGTNWPDTIKEFVRKSNILRKADENAKSWKEKYFPKI
jgi:hypothetical protein